MSNDPYALIVRALVGRSCIVSRREHDWALTFSGDVTLVLPVPWRIVHAGRIVVADQDDGQRFGRPAPVKGLAQKRGSKRSITLPDNESWQIQRSAENGGLLAVALGGGEVAIW